MAALKAWRTAILGLALAAPNALAADCPQPPCFVLPPTLVVGFGPGGPTDKLARFLAKEMQPFLNNQPVIVDNKSGAGGSAAIRFVMDSKRDGEVILFAPTYALAASNKLYKMEFDPVKDVMPVALVAEIPQVLIVNSNVPAKSLGEFIDLVKRKPGGFRFGSAGIGSFSHLLMAQLGQTAGVQLIHVPYKSPVAASMELQSGHVEATMIDVGSANKLVKSGKARALAITGRKRSALAPDIFTFAEQGVHGFEVGVLYGLVYPSNTHPNIVSRLNTAARSATKSDQARSFFREQGFEPIEDSSTEFFERQFRSENERWAKVIRSAGIRVE